MNKEEAADLMGAAFTEYKKAYRSNEDEVGSLYPRSEYGDIISYMLSKIWPDYQQLQDSNKHLKGKAEFDMPAAMQGRFYHACTDSCDMIDGPCACGARHSAKEWVGKLNKTIEQLQAKLDALRWIPVSERLPKEVGKYDVYGGITKWEEYFSKFEDGEMRWMRRNLTITHWRLITLPEPADGKT